MHGLRTQRGLGLWGLIFVLSVIGLVALVLIKSIPAYLNEGTISRDLHEVATKAGSSGSEIDPTDVKLDIQRRWDIDYVTNLDPKEIKVTRNARGWNIDYAYQVKVKLFYNLSLVMDFAQTIPINRKGGSGP
jgi:hypothetical protein